MSCALSHFCCYRNIPAPATGVSFAPGDWFPSQITFFSHTLLVSSLWVCMVINSRYIYFLKKKIKSGHYSLRAQNRAGVEVSDGGWIFFLRNLIEESQDVWHKGIREDIPRGTIKGGKLLIGYPFQPLVSAEWFHSTKHFSLNLVLKVPGNWTSTTFPESP